MNRALQFLASGAGLALSVLATVIELRHEQDPDYVAVCDLTETVSCSKVMSSEYGHMLSLMGLVPKGSPLDRSNAEFGIIFFLILLAVLLIGRDYPRARGLFLLLSAVSAASSVSLGYLMVVHIQSTCVLCVGIYGCCAVNFIASIADTLTRSKKDKTIKTA